MFYLCLKDRSETYPLSRYSCVHIPRRLVTTSCVRTPTMATQQGGSGNYSEPRFHSQQGQVETGSSSELQFFRCQARFGIGSSGPFPRQNRQISYVVS